MAMIRCAECGADVSSKAAACPKCGNPIKKAPAGRRGCGTLLVYGIIGTIVLMAMVLFDSGDQPSSTPGKTAPPSPDSIIDKSPEKQAGRAKLIADLQSRRIFSKFDCRDRAADVWVRPAFDALAFDDKQLFVSVVYAYCHDRKELGTFVTVRSHLTNKELGTFTAERGLRLE
jgi:hypothetical protein